MTLLIGDRTTTELPLPVVRWLEVAWPAGADDVRTVTIAGPLRMRRGHLRLRGDATMRVDLGRAYVNDIRIGLGPMTAMRGFDALVDGTGITVVGGETSLGAEIDQGAFLALWCQSILFPAAWRHLPGLRWTPVDDREVVVGLPFRGETQLAMLRFDPAGSTLPVSFHVHRYREVGKPKVGWRVDYDAWHWVDGLPHPTRLRVQWDDEPAPWFDLRVESVKWNGALDSDLDRARETIRRAQATHR
jgi:hypothetical protein